MNLQQQAVQVEQENGDISKYSRQRLGKFCDVSQKKLKTFLTTYNKLSETCFVDCIHDFTNRTVSGNEVNVPRDNSTNSKDLWRPRKGKGGTQNVNVKVQNSCAMNCAEKFLKMSQRVGIRFQEIQEINIAGGAKS